MSKLSLCVIVLLDEGLGTNRESKMLHRRRRRIASSFKETSFKVGIVGMRGAGKSTFFRHVCNMQGVPVVPANPPSDVIVTGAGRREYILSDVPFVEFDDRFDRFNHCVLVISAESLLDSADRTLKPSAFDIFCNYAQKLSACGITGTLVVTHVDEISSSDLEQQRAYNEFRDFAMAATDIFKHVKLANLLIQEPGELAAFLRQIVDELLRR